MNFARDKVKLEWAPPATVDALRRIERLPLPEEHISFLKQHDGGEGAIGENHFHLLSCEKIAFWTENRVEFHPDEIVIGTDGAERAIAGRRPCKDI
jgi:hypothetical protein